MSPLLADQALMDVGDDTTSCDSSLNQAIELLVTSNCQLQVARGDSLHLQILAGISSQLQHLGKKIDSRGPHLT